MTDAELKKLKDDLWHSADILRSGAHIAANKYGQPILGLIFLRYADILFKQHKDEIDKEYNSKKGGRNERPYKEICVEKCGFYLPECAYFDFINDCIMNHIYIEQPPMYGNITFEQLEYIYDKYKIKPVNAYVKAFGKMVKIRRPVVAAEKYTIKLKHHFIHLVVYKPL